MPRKPTGRPAGRPRTRPLPDPATPKRRRGRPAGSRRDDSLGPARSVRLSPAEDAAAVASAESQGVVLSAWIRAAVRRALGME